MRRRASAIDYYDPDTAPDPQQWLALDEAQRIRLVREFHRERRIALPRSAREAHAVFHAIVENQLALNVEAVVQALPRLMGEGLSRHDAVHAIGSVLAEYMHDLQRSAAEDKPRIQRYYEAVNQLTMAKWHGG